MSDSPVTTQTSGVSNTIYSRRRSQARQYLKILTKSINIKGRDRDNLINKSDDLRQFIEESVYNRKFDGMSKSLSDMIKEFIIRSITKGYSMDRVMNYMQKKGIDSKQAAMIYRTENHELRNKVKEWSYQQLDGYDQMKFKWIGPKDHRTTEICKNISDRTENGVTIDEIKIIINEEVNKAVSEGKLPSGYDPRDYTPHFGCRHTYVKVRL